jgi:hypothetical protein
VVDILMMIEMTDKQVEIMKVDFEEVLLVVVVDLLSEEVMKSSIES